MIEKLKSRKFFICLWAIAAISFIIVTDKKDFLSLADVLALVPLAYSGLNVWQKKKSMDN